MKKQDIEIESLRKAINGLGSAFNWEHSKEGDAYWREVSEKLQSYRREYYNTDDCCEKIAKLEEELRQLKAMCL